MSAAILEPQIFDELKAALNHGIASGELLTHLQIEQQTALFRERFGPAVLRDLDGEALLRLMHGRLTGETRCLAYRRQFKNDDEFSGNQFGRVWWRVSAKIRHLPAAERQCLDDGIAEGTERPIA